MYMYKQKLTEIGKTEEMEAYLIPGSSNSLAKNGPDSTSLGEYSCIQIAIYT